MKKVIAILAAVAILVGGIIAGVSYRTGGKASGDEPPQLPPGPELADPQDVDPDYVPGPEIRIPTLTAQERAWAKEAALSDSRVQELIEGKDYEIVSISVIHTTVEQGLEKIGASVSINFSKSHDIEYDWPLIEPTEGAQKWSDYQETTRHTKETVKALDIMIFFCEDTVNDGKVVTIVPLPFTVSSL